MATNKKEAFRQYLEAAGVLDTITKSKANASTELVLHLRLMHALSKACGLQFWSACTKSLSDRRTLLSERCTLSHLWSYCAVC